MPRSRRRTLLLLALAVANAALFLPAMRGGFFWDDKILVSENPFLSGPDFWRTFLTAPFTGPSGWDRNSAALDRGVPFYRPLTALSYRLDLDLWGFNPAAFHLTNILLQVLNTLLFVLLLFRLGFKDEEALAGGLLFTLFPLHFESVAWISGRTDLLAFAAGSLALLCIFRFREGKCGLWGTLAGGAYFLALLAKESLVLLPGLAFLVLFFPGRRLKRALSGLAFFSVPFLLWVGLRSAAVRSPTPDISLESAGRVFSALGFYAGRILFPFRLGLTVDAGRVFGNPAYLGMGLAVGLALVAAWAFIFKGKGRSPAAAAGASASLLVAPALAVVLSPSVESLLAWRFLYPLTALFVLAAVWAAFKFLPRPAAAVVLAGLGILYLVEIHPKVGWYAKDEAEIWLSVDPVGREDALARLNIGLVWLEKDERRGLSILDGLTAETRRPGRERFGLRVAEELAAHFVRTKEPAKARLYFEEVLRSGTPPSTFFFLNYAVFLVYEGRPEEGERLIAKILELFPENHLVLLNAARFYAVAGNNEKAADCLRKDYALFPSPQTLEEIRALERSIK
jgi:tetratricopeptide (TPR) repeat protein